jgi:hypothetical protein
MRQTAPPLFMGTSKTLAGFAIFFLLLAVFFGFLNGQKMKALRANLANAQAGRDAVERRQAQAKLNAPADASGAAEQQSKITEAENRATKAETELAQAQKDKADLQARLDANQQETVSLQKRIEETGKNTNPSTPGSSPADASHSTDLQSQIDDLHGQLDAAEKEKALLAEKLRDAPERTNQPKEGKKRREGVSGQRETAAHRAGVRGSILAYNQAYNFVVLNLGARNGVETNSEMLVVRDGTFIGKIRISSVEPATAIGDIISNSLARGVQVQPGDTVIYAGTNP